MSVIASRVRPRGMSRFGSLLGRSGAAALLCACLIGQVAHGHEAPNHDGNCAAVGTWIEPATGQTVAPDRLLDSLAHRPVVLLGESHDDVEHHRWQLQTLAALHGRHPNMAIGFESFPRRVQPVLDRWASGELGTKAFLEAVDWRAVWGFDPELYLPLFHFARQNRIPMIALNVERALVTEVGNKGWNAIALEDREGVSDPAPASDGYRESLARLYLFKQSFGAHGGSETSDEEDAAIASVLESDDFARFVQAQLTWDRAMAEALATAHRRDPEGLVVGIMGRGHVQHRHGVPSQLADLGIADAAVLLPVERSATCEGLATDLADAAFVLDPPQRVAERPRPMLGIQIETTEDGVRISRVIEDSVAAASGLEVGDIVVSAARFPVAKVGELIEIVRRQAPGTWLPLTIRRDDAEREIVAKFPTVFTAPR